MMRRRDWRHSSLLEWKNDWDWWGGMGWKPGCLPLSYPIPHSRSLVLLSFTIYPDDLNHLVFFFLFYICFISGSLLFVFTVLLYCSCTGYPRMVDIGKEWCFCCLNDQLLSDTVMVNSSTNRDIQPRRKWSSIRIEHCHNYRPEESGVNGELCLMPEPEEGRTMVEMRGIVEKRGDMIPRYEHWSTFQVIYRSSI